MVGVDWEIAKSRRTCSITGRTLDIGEVYYSAIREEKDSFLREDFSLEAWETIDPSRFYSYWRAKVRDESRKKPPTVDLEAIYAFFASLEKGEERSKKIFRYLLALFLIRKRLLRLDRTEETSEGDLLHVTDLRSHRSLTIVAPKATSEELEEAQGMFLRIFECPLATPDLLSGAKE